MFYGNDRFLFHCHDCCVHHWLHFDFIEHLTHVNKTVVALLMAISCWILQFSNSSWSHVENMTFFRHHLAEISQVVFFLTGALSVVEITSTHNGFQMISDRLHVSSKRKLLGVAGFLVFFLSSILDNLTATIVMISLPIKLIQERDTRLLIGGGGVVIAADAGGAWTNRRCHNNGALDR